MLTAGCGVRVGGWVVNNGEIQNKYGVGNGLVVTYGGKEGQGRGVQGVKEVAVQRFGQVAWQGRLNLGDHKLAALPSMQMSRVTSLGACRHRH
jgi:hypothetical protein